MVSIDLEYEGELHTRAVHGPSGMAMATDAPRDNQGRGESFSPTDLVAAALGSCILTVMGIAARSLDVDMVGATAHVEKEMCPAPERRIRSLKVAVRVPKPVAAEDRARLERAAHSCPVHRSLNPEVETEIHFGWNEA